MKKRITYLTQILSAKKEKKKSNGIDSVQPQKIMSIYFDRLYSHFGIGLLMYGRVHKKLCEIGLTWTPLCISVFYREVEVFQMRNNQGICGI